MIQQIINNKKFGPIAVGNPTLTNFPKHSDISDALNDIRVVSMDILEVRTNEKVHVVVTSTNIKVDSDLILPREVKKLLSALQDKFKSHKNLSPKFRLLSYDYVQD